jgi:3-dehydroquinate synthase
MSPINERVDVELADRRYQILIGRQILSRPDSFIDGTSGDQALVVSNDTVASLYAETLMEALRPTVKRVQLLNLPDGEQYKTWESLQKVFDALIASASDRRTTLFALGGGVVGDLTGFAAACYMRGVPYVQVPTTLLAQVDSSVGGKTAINHPLGKNMIGAFHQPVRVVTDLDTLDTLPQRELIAGLAEVIKYGPIADAEFLHWIENNVEGLLGRDKVALAYAVAKSCRLKASVVGDDELETGRRAILNFGHTFGHAIETGLGFGTWLHGEAVGCGMVLAANLSARAGLIEFSYADRLRRLIESVGLPVTPPALETERWIELMRLDKKARSGDLRFVLLNGEGRAKVCAVPIHLVAEVIESSR